MHKKLLMGMLMACPSMLLTLEQPADTAIEQLSKKLEEKISHNIQKKYYKFGAMLTNAILPDQERIAKTVQILQKEALEHPEKLDKYNQLTEQEQEACLDWISKIVIVFCATSTFEEHINNNKNIASYMAEYACLKKDIAPANPDLNTIYKKLVD